VAAITEVEYKL